MILKKCTTSFIIEHNAKFIFLEKWANVVLHFVHEFTDGMNDKQDVDYLAFEASLKAEVRKISFTGFVQITEQ